MSETVAWWHGLGWSFKSAVAGQMNRREIGCGWVGKLNQLGLGVAGGVLCSETPTPVVSTVCCKEIQTCQDNEKLTGSSSSREL